MRSTFAGLDIAYRALQAQQQAIDVVNHNIANANTPGYSRQVAKFASTPPYSASSFSINAGPGQTGAGVDVIDVSRSRNAFIDYQIRLESQTLGRWERAKDTMRQVELVFNEPSDSGLSSLLTKFWQAWQDLTSAPQDAGARTALLEQAESMAVAFNRKHSQLNALRRDVDQQLRVGLDRTNLLAERIAAMNVQIVAVELTGQRANDLRDQRDLALDELSRLARVSYGETPQGAMNVFVGGRALVSGSKAETLAVRPNTLGFADIVWEGDEAGVSLSDGELVGLRQVRDVEVPRYIADLQALGQELISRVNQVHSSGYGLDNSSGLAFFIGTGADDISINSDLRTSPEKVAAAARSDAPGDNTAAMAIARLHKALTMNGGTTDFGRYFASVIARLGVDSQRANMMVANQQILVDHLNRQRASTSGVSLDEETTRLIEYQRAYQAAARVVNAVDEMLDTLINGVGLVGR